MKIGIDQSGTMNIFDEQAWRRFYGVDSTTRSFDYSILDETCPLTKGKRVGETHYLFRGNLFVNDVVPLTIMEWHKLAAHEGHPKIFGGMGPYWYERDACARNTTCSDAWYLIYAGLIPGSDNQVSYRIGAKNTMFVPEGYRVPSGIELLTAQLTHLRAFDKPLLENKWAWTSDCVTHDHHMIIGHYERSAERGDACIRINLNSADEERGSVGFMPIRSM